MLGEFASARNRSNNKMISRVLFHRDCILNIKNYRNPTLSRNQNENYKKNLKILNQSKLIKL